LRKNKPLAHVISDDKEKFTAMLGKLKQKFKGSRLAKLDKNKNKVILLKTKNKEQDAAIIGKLLNRDRHLSKKEFQKKNKFEIYDKKQTEKVSHDIIMESFLKELKTISKLSEAKQSHNARSAYQTAIKNPSEYSKEELNKLRLAKEVEKWPNAEFTKYINPDGTLKDAS